MYHMASLHGRNHSASNHTGGWQKQSYKDRILEIYCLGSRCICSVQVKHVNTKHSLARN